LFGMQLGKECLAKVAKLLPQRLRGTERSYPDPRSKRTLNSRVMTLSYILDEHGWASATIGHQDQRREMRVSYCSDALLRLIEAAISLKEGAESARFGFTDEPGEHEGVVTTISPHHVRIRVFWYKQWTPPGPDTGDEVFSCDCAVLDFYNEVFRCCKQVLDEHGEEGYKERWIEHEFPSERFEHLSRLLFPPRKKAVAQAS